MMLETYRGHGLEFRYPGSWELDEQSAGSQISITVASPGTSFWTLTLFGDDPGPENVLESALAAYRDEYEELDVYPAAAAPRGVIGRDVEFVCLELLNSAFLRTFQIGDRRVLVLYQGTDHELEQTRTTLQAIARSLRPTDDEP